MKVLIITGTRKKLTKEFKDQIDTVLLKFSPDHVILGDCPTGIDRHVRDTVRTYGFKYTTHVALWDEDGRSAGPKRNSRMVQQAVLHKGDGDDVFAYAFPSGTSKGTWDCVRKIVTEGIDCYVTRADTE